MQREKTERDQDKETPHRREVEKRRVMKERSTHVLDGKPPKCTETSKSFHVKPSLTDLPKEKEARHVKTTNHSQETQEERRPVQKLHEKRSSHSDRHRTPDYNKSYVTSAERTSGSRSGSIWKPGCQPIVMQEERRPSQVKTDPVSVVPMSLKKKMFWKKRDKMEPESKFSRQYSDVANMEYDECSEELRRRSNSKQQKTKSFIKYPRKRRSDHDMDDDCCEIMCETDDVQDEDCFSNQPGASKENITLWQDGSRDGDKYYSRFKKCQGLERIGVTVSLILLTVLIVGGVMYYYKVYCAKKPLPISSHQYDFTMDTRQRVKKSDDYGMDSIQRNNWDEANIKTVDGIGGLSDYLGIRDWKDLQWIGHSDEPSNLKLQDFIKRLIETDNQIKEIRNSIMGVNLSKDNRYLKSERYKRSVRWRHGPRLLYKKQRTEAKIEERTEPKLEESSESPVEQEAREVQEQADQTQQKATEVAEQATTAVTIPVKEPNHTKSFSSTITTKSKSNARKHFIPTSYKEFKVRNKKKTTSHYKNKKKRLQRNADEEKKETNENKQTTKTEKNPAIAIIIPNKRLFALYGDTKRKFTKCTHVSKEQKSHEEHLKHPFYKNTEHLDKFLDMLLEVQNTSRESDSQVDDIFKKKKTKCKHPSIVIDPIKLIQDKKGTVQQNIDYARDEVVKLRKMFTSTQMMQKINDMGIEAVTTTTQSLPTLMTKVISPKYNIFMSILTINPDQHATTTEDLRSLIPDRRLHGRRLMQVPEDPEELGLVYEDLKELLSDDKISYALTRHEVDRRKNKDNVIKINNMALTNQELLQLNVIKPTQAKAKLYNPNWKGPMPLYPDELNMLMKRQYKNNNKEKIPIRNNDVLEENGEDEGVFNDVDYVEDYSIGNNNNGIAAKRAQAYSDYGVLAKVGGNVESRKNNPSEKHIATTKISDKLGFEKEPDPAQRSKKSVNDPRNHKHGNKNCGRIGRTLKSIKNSIDDDLNNYFNDTRKIEMKKRPSNTSIKIKSLTKHRYNKKNRYTYKFLPKFVNTKKNTDSAISPYDDDPDPDFFEHLKFRRNNTSEITDPPNLTAYTNEITDSYGKILNFSFLDDMFQKVKVTVTAYDDLNDRINSLLDATEVETQMTLSVKDLIKSTTVDVTSESLDVTVPSTLPSKSSKSTVNVPTMLPYEFSDMLKTTIQFPAVLPSNLTGNTLITTERPSFFDDLIYYEDTTASIEMQQQQLAAKVRDKTDMTLNEKDMFSHLSNWLCAIVATASNVSTATSAPRFQDDNLESIENKYQSRTLKSLEHKFENETAENITDLPFQSLSPSNIDNATTNFDNNNVTIKENEVTNAKELLTETVANKTLVKRNADDGSSFVYFSDVYDEDYGVDVNPFEKRSQKRKGKMFMKKQKEWIQKKVKKISDTIHSNPYKKILMVKEHSELNKNADGSMQYNDTRYRRNPPRLIRAQRPLIGPVIDFNVLNTKMKEICSQAVNEVQQMRKVQAREDEITNPTSSLMQQLAQLMSDLVDLQVKQKTCRKLPPDLQEFLHWLTAPDTKQRPLSASMLKPGASSGEEEFASETFEVTNDYGIAGLHDMEATLGYQSTTGPSIQDLKPQCANAMRSVENLLYDYDELNADSKKKISGVRDYLNNQLNFLRNQVDINDLSTVYNTRYRREANDHHYPTSARDKRKFVRNFSKKHTKTTANNIIDDSQSAAEQPISKVDESKQMTISIDKQTKGGHASNERYKKNLRDVYYRALSESNKFSTSTTTEKHS